MNLININPQHTASLFIIVLLVSCSPTTDPEVAGWENQARNVEILRDDFGVPHIYGKTDADAVFGLLYAQCEDDFRRVERNFTWALGRLAEVEGEEALFSDLRAQLFMTEAEAKAYFESAPYWLQILCIAWADGINFYLYKHPEVQPKAIKKYEPWMTMYFTEGSIGGDIERVSSRKIKSFYQQISAEAGELLSSAADTKEHRGGWPEEPKGSNGFALSGDLTASGNAMLLINPHTSFYFRCEVHVVSEEGLNAYGAVTWGQFFVYQGFNEQTGWMHTSTGTDIIDEFQEEIIQKGDSLSYKYGTEVREIASQEVTLKYLSEGELKERVFPIYRTHHGPITQIANEKWTATALMWDPVNALIQSYTRTKNRDLNEFNEMMEMCTNSSNNTVFADSDGNIAYYHGNFVPKRNPAFDYSKPVDGSDPATDWKGIHPLEEQITIMNPPNGWIQNCNSTPFTAAGKSSPKAADFPDYMTSFPENFRAINAQRLLAKANQFTLDSLIAIAYDNYLPAFTKVIPGLISAYDQADSTQKRSLVESIDLLGSWDYRTHTSSVAMTLAHYYGMNLYQQVEIPKDLTGMERFHYFGTDLAPERRLQVFESAVTQLEEDFGSWDIPWGKINRFQRLSGAIDASFNDSLQSIPVGFTTGWWGHLAAYGMRGKHDVKKIYGTRGNSFVAVVEFGEEIKAKSILAGGQSSNPDSPHFNDQAMMYSQGEFKDVAFYRSDVEARAEEQYRPGTR
ncbi:MAG: penicillin acylase family protein [Bacteroidota bacterium]